MMLKNPSKVNHEEWIIVYFRLDNREQLSKIVSVFKKNILELHQYINGWYFNQYIEPSNPKKEDQYRYKIFIQKKTNAKKENVTELINKITGEIMVEIKNTYKPNPDFDSECIVNYLESRNGILDIDLNLLSTKIRELIEKEIGLKPDEDQMFFILHMLFNQFSQGGDEYDLNVGLKLVQNSLNRQGPKFKVTFQKI